MRLSVSRELHLHKCGCGGRAGEPDESNPHLRLVDQPKKAITENVLATVLSSRLKRGKYVPGSPGRNQDLGSLYRGAGPETWI
jgi:hypothetical protein